MQVLYSLQGVRGLQDVIERATTDVKRGLEAACRETALGVQRRAQQLVPKDRGDLARAIQVEGRGVRWRVGLEDRRLASRGGDRTKPGRSGRLVGAVHSAHVNPSVYGVWYELGFVTKKIARRPYMAPAAEAEQPLHERRIVAVLAKSLTGGRA